MAVYFLNLKTFGRSGGSSAVSAAAYRAGERIKDERSGRTYDHSDRRDVMHKEILLPSEFAADDMAWAKDRANLWNASEEAETRKNARVAREYLVALPVELSPDERVGLVQGFSQELADRYRFAVDVAIHAPRDFPGSDPRNFHAHLLATTREVTTAGLGAKTTLEWNDASRSEIGLGPAINELLHVRQRWAEVTNEALHAARIDARIDHRSLQAQGIDREPKLHIPRVAYEMERHGYRSGLAERLRAEHQARLDARLQHSPAREQQLPWRERQPGAPHQSTRAHQQNDGQQAAHEQQETRDGKETPDPQATRDQHGTREKQETRGAQPRAAVPVQSLDDIRREARENWLRMRNAGAQFEHRGSAGRSRDDDLGR